MRRALSARYDRRMVAPEAGAAMRVVATLPAGDALLASERLEEGGIPASLRPSDGGSLGDATATFDVLVAERRVADARSLLLRPRRPQDPAHSQTLVMIAVVTGVALVLSAAMFVARWLLSGSPLPR
ncbi:MAG TPA: hypothetical protein VGB64_11080 [Actinomycetota bacterium]